ncbi:unnamed protein product [Adineta steineri]|uniref:ATP-grasp domain-containing protein n=1 Tax=Adineta steineri TaxID=433720 RepID=A0A818HQK2_9BILA|nr:unnamed protein product [Adineta steineri]CAF0982076.1 unnamed protein product [Adineta steineri]CAF3494550.1 unnamed protein product [Adineta steineri]CAF3512700.1 unnamed protein product [Adineta steineri]
MADEHQSTSASDHPNVLTTTDNKTSNSIKKSEPHRENTLYTEPIPKCYIGVGNNPELIESILTSAGYERQTERTDDFKLKWVQCNSSVNWNVFKDGEQMVNHIQGEDYFTTKIQLWQSLQSYEKITLAANRRPNYFLTLNEFVPETYKLDEKNDRDAFFNIHKPGDVWICKPSGLNQGKGIYLVRDIDNLKSKFAEIDAMDKKKQVALKPMKRVIQRYIMNPLLVHGKKFDIRCFMLISSVKPLIALYHKGYLRLSMFDFDANDGNLLTHLTNQYMQKKDPKYYDLKEDTSWTMEQFNDYINEHILPNKNIEKDWVLNVLPKIIQRIMLNIIDSIRMRLKRRVGCFGLYGYDFMIDEEMKVWLIEVNVNPALATNTNTLLQAIPPVVQESILLSIECFEKIRHNQRIFPLRSIKGFRCIYNELERKGSLPYLEQKRTTSSTSSANIQKNPPQNSSPSNKPNLNNSLTNSPTSPKILPKITEQQQQQQTSVTQKSPTTTTTNVTRPNQERAKLTRSSDSFISSTSTSTPPTTTTITTITHDPMVMRYQTIQRYRTNFEMLKPATVIAEDWKNLDKTQKDRLGVGGAKTLGHGTIASTSSSPSPSPSSPIISRQQDNWLVSGRQLTIVDTKTLGTWLKLKQHEHKELEEQQQQQEQFQSIKETNNHVEKSCQTSLGISLDVGSSSSSSQTPTNQIDIRSSLNLVNNQTKINKIRPTSAKLRTHSLSPADKPLKLKEKHNNTKQAWEYDDWYNLQDLTGITNKSALIYRLMRSRLEANLAKSITMSKDQANNKKKVSESTTT